MRLTGRGQLISVGLRGDGTPSLPPSPPPRISARIIRGLACRPPLLFSSFSLFPLPPPFSSAFFEIRGQFGPNTGHRPLSAPVFTHERSVRFTGDDRFIDNPGQSFSFRDESIMFPPSRINSFPPGINNTGGLNREKEIGYVSSPWPGGKWTWMCVVHFINLIAIFKLNHEILPRYNCW